MESHLEFVRRILWSPIKLRAEGVFLKNRKVSD